MKTRTSLLLSIVAVVFSAIVFFAECKGNEDDFRERENNYKATLTYLIKIRAEGNCLRSEKKDNGKSVLYCDRRPMGLCNAGDMIYTSGDRTFRLWEISDINKKTSDCATFILQAGLSSESVTTDSEESTILSNNSYKAVAKCEDTGLATDYSTLFTSAELTFIISTIGKIAIKAEAASISTASSSLQSKGKSCLDVILKDETTGSVSEDKKKVLENLRTGAKKTNVNCTLGDSTSSSKCPDTVDAF